MNEDPVATMTEPTRLDEPSARSGADDRGEDIRPAYLLGALSAGAGVIHLMMAPVHAASSQLEAATFAAAGWFQIVVAMLLVFRPSRRWLALAGIGNGVIVAAWVWSRTKGLPYGSHAWEPEEIGGVDLTAALFEAGIIVGALAQLLPRPAVRVPVLLPALGAAAVLAVTTAVLVNPTTSSHHGDAAVETTAGAGVTGATPVSAPARCDESLNPRAYWNEARAAGTDGATPVAAAAAPAAGGGHAHGHGATPAPAATADPATPTTLGPLKGRGSKHYDRLIELANKPGEAAAGFLIAELANASDAEYHEFIASLNPANKAGGHEMEAEGTGNNSDAASHTMSHLGPQPWRPMSDPADCDEVRKELARSKAVADKFPTAADAMKEGYVRVAPYVPGIASHWMKFDLVDGTFDVDKPEMLLYDGNGPDSHITGISYYVNFDSNTAPSQGFTGDNDLYHRHIGLCNGPTGVIGDSTTTDEECKAAGGRKSGGGNGWMSHAWVVPGCESPWGVFSGINPLLDQQLGQQSGKNDGGCAGSAVQKRYDLSPGSPATMPTTTVAPTNEQAAG